MNNVLYRNNPPFVNLNLYHRRNSLTKSNTERLLRQLRKYRDEYRLAGSRVVSNTIKNLENSLVRSSVSGPRTVTRENLLKARSRLKPSYRRTPFSASNLQKAKANLTRRKSPQTTKLANLTLRKLIGTGKGANVPWHIIPTGSLRRALSKPKITQANVRVGKTNMNIVKNFKSYMNLVKNAQEYASGNNNNSGNLNRMFRNSLNSYRNRYGLTPEQGQRIYSTVLKIARFPKPGMSRSLVKMREKYLKTGFLNAKDVGFIMNRIKGSS